MESATSSSAATMSSGEKYRMVSESNDLFLHLMKNLQQEHAEELRNNRIQNNKLYYTRQDYSKNEKKLKRAQQQLNDLRDEIAVYKQEIISTGDDTFGTHCQRVFEQGVHVTEHLQHQRLCAGRERHQSLLKFGQAFAREKDEMCQKRKSKFRRIFERVFGLKKRQQEKLNADVNSMLMGDVVDTQLEVVRVLKKIQHNSSSSAGLRSGGTVDLSGELLQKLGH